MNVVPTPDFTEKVRALLSSPQTLNHVARLVKAIADTNKDDLLAARSPVKVVQLGEELFVVSSGSVSLFITIGKKGNQEHAVILDVVDRSRSDNPDSFFAVKDPRRDSLLNPLVNQTINPMVNSVLNPNINPTLNPSTNSLLNPQVNPGINPRINASLNPDINPSINPNVNPSINPLINPALNPKINRTFGGPFLYDLQLHQEGFVVRANDKVLLLFEMSLQFRGIGILNDTNGYTLFNRSNEWVGYLVPDSQGGYLHFNTSNEWKGIAV